MTARRALHANAIFTAASATVLIAARESLYPLFALTSPTVLTTTGLVLLLYAASLMFEARRRPPKRQALIVAAWLDAGWVAGSAILLAVAWASLAPAGRALIVAAAIVVEAFAFIQFRLSRTMSAQPFR